MSHENVPVNRLLIVASLLFITGCAAITDGPGATSATVTAPSGMNVEAAVTAVFGAHGYSKAGSDKETLVFERPGSRADQLLYGDFEETPMKDRVKVRIESTDSGRFRITCVGYAVRVPTGHFAGDASLEDPIRRLQLFSSQLSRMLTEVKERLR